MDRVRGGESVTCQNLTKTTNNSKILTNKRTPEYQRNANYKQEESCGGRKVRLGQVKWGGTVTPVQLANRQRRPAFHCGYASWGKW